MFEIKSETKFSSASATVFIAGREMTWLCETHENKLENVPATSFDFCLISYQLRLRFKRAFGRLDDDNSKFLGGMT